MAKVRTYVVEMVEEAVSGAAGAGGVEAAVCSRAAVERVGDDFSFAVSS